jgi:hypothetical protein
MSSLNWFFMIAAGVILMDLLKIKRINLLKRRNDSTGKEFRVPLYPFLWLAVLVFYLINL